MLLVDLLFEHFPGSKKKKRCQVNALIRRFNFCSNECVHLRLTTQRGALFFPQQQKVEPEVDVTSQNELFEHHLPRMPLSTKVFRRGTCARARRTKRYSGATAPPAGLNGSRHLIVSNPATAPRASQSWSSSVQDSMLSNHARSRCAATCWLISVATH